jgi:hypothetical protein
MPTPANEPAASTSNEETFGAAAALRKGGKAVCLTVPSGSRREIRDDISRRCNRPLVYDSESAPGGDLSEAKIAATLSALKKDQLLVAYGVNYGNSVEGFPVLMVIRDTKDFNFAQASGLYFKIVGAVPILLLMWQIKPEDRAS